MLGFIVCLFVFVFFTDLEQDGFSKNPFFHGIIAEVPEQHKTKDGEEGQPTALFTPLTTVTY